jgi:site-specific recombinase XerD
MKRENSPEKHLRGTEDNRPMDQLASTHRYLPGRGGVGWVESYQAEVLAGKDARTQDAYGRVLVDFSTWLAHQPGSDGQFRPTALTRNAVKTYFDIKKGEKAPLSRVERAGELPTLPDAVRPLRYAPTSLARMKVALSGFVAWLIEQGELLANPIKDIAIPRMAARPPRILSPKQRFALKNVVERATSPLVRKNGEVAPGDLRARILRGAACLGRVASSGAQHARWTQDRLGLGRAQT